LRRVESTPKFFSHEGGIESTTVVITAAEDFATSVSEPQGGYTTTVEAISAQSCAHVKYSPKVWTNSENWVNSTSLELKATPTVSNIAKFESPSKNSSTVKFYAILSEAWLVICQISSDSSQKWSIGTESARVPACNAHDESVHSEPQKRLQQQRDIP